MYIYKYNNIYIFSFKDDVPIVLPHSRSKGTLDELPGELPIVHPEKPVRKEILQWFSNVPYS